MKSFLVLIGASGSGKSSLSKRLVSGYPGTVVCSADDVMVRKEGGYTFDAERLRFAHDCTRTKVKKALEKKAPIVVLDNTNTSARDIEPYVELARYKVRFIVFPEVDLEVLAARNLHGVPKETLLSQRDRIRHLLKNWPEGWPAYENAPPWKG